MPSEHVSIFDPTLKTNTKYTGRSPLMLASPALEDYAHHWGLNAAVEGLAAYQHWISSMVLPIVFQWIDEHHDEIYARVDKVGQNLRDDLDTVIKVAFEMVREKKAYEEGRKELEEFEMKMASGTLDTSTINPTWTTISAHLREEMREALKHESEPLVAAMP